MHELSIALSILDVAGETLAREGGGHVEAIHLKIGPLSGVVPDALLSAWDLACEQSPLTGSRLVIENVPVAVYCAQCEAERPVVSIQEMRCARCGTLCPRVVRGRELEVTAMEIVDEPANAEIG
jgi:hydrogenase nickel incorporation protein HypA/HybF